MSVEVKLPEAKQEQAPEQKPTMLLPRERIDEFSDPANQTGLPRPVGAELDDPDNGSMLTRRDKTKLMQMMALKQIGRV